MSQRATTGIQADEGGRDASGAGAPNRASGTGCRWSVTPVKAQNAIANARRHATSHLDSEYTHDPAER